MGLIHEMYSAHCNAKRLTHARIYWNISDDDDDDDDYDDDDEEEEEEDDDDDDDNDDKLQLK